jgi:4-hydroxybenzoate polyprenyltransferase
MMAVLLALGIVTFRRFEQRTSLWRRVLKFVAILALTAVISYFFGRTGVIIWFGIAALPVIFIHAIWLPRHGVNGWTGEPRERYYALRGWPPPER